MLVRDMRRLALCAGPLLVLIYVLFHLFSTPEVLKIPINDWLGSKLPNAATGKQAFDPKKPALFPPPSSSDDSDTTSGGVPVFVPVPGLPKTDTATGDTVKGDTARGGTAEEDTTKPNEGVKTGGLDQLARLGGSDGGTTYTHTELFSSTTEDKKFFYVNMGEIETMNANIIPHPSMLDTWIVVAQQQHSQIDRSVYFAELSCNAQFKDGALSCLQAPITVPIASTIGDKCEGDYVFFNNNIGPHDARVFYGPDGPWAVYGSNSAYNCFSLFMQDFRRLVDWGLETTWGDFVMGTELQRPPPYSKIEKNWFPFWDTEGQMYIHYDVQPKRVFARINGDGSAGPDLAPAVAAQDDACMARYMPKLGPELESIHQSTNALRVTMCSRADPACVADESNTFIFNLFQHKTYFSYHAVYEPYVMVFKQRAPFGLYAISTKPLWIHGRERHPEQNTSDMFYVVSMSWKTHGQHDHGYLDDDLFLSFGIEDKMAAGIDVKAAQVLQNLGLCAGGF